MQNTFLDFIDFSHQVENYHGKNLIYILNVLKIMVYFKY